MSWAADLDSPLSVLVVGPSPTHIGGMSSVISQTLSLDYGSRFRTSFMPNTESPGSAESSFRRIVRHVQQLRELRRNIVRDRIQIVHVHTCSGFSFYRSAVDAEVARRSGCRVVLHIHGAAFDEFVARSSKLGQTMIARVLERADRVIALSGEWKSRLLSISPRARVVVVENAVAVPANVVAEGGGDTCRFTLLAKMDTWKGIDDLLDACAQMAPTNRARLDVTLAGPAGSAGDRAEIDRKIRDRGLGRSVRYVGPVEGDDKSKLLRQSDAYVQPSHHEGMPIAVLEALSHGLPVVGTKVGAMPEVVGATGAGILVEPREPAQLASAMLRVAESAEFRGQLSARARALAEERFSLTRLRNDLVALYDEIVAGTGWA